MALRNICRGSCQPCKVSFSAAQQSTVRWIACSTTAHRRNMDSEPDNRVADSGEEFRKFQLRKRIDVIKRTRSKFSLKLFPPRYTKMPVGQDWTNVWPAARSFNPSVVPLPIHQGYVKKNRIPPNKFGNLELMKIPNFFHLTPPAIKKHCATIKQFCTAWPIGLETDEHCEKHFPVEVITSSYCHSGPSIRDPKARIVTLQVRLSSLQLDDHARDKLLRLIGERYDNETDIMTLVVERCPMKKQNYDYAQYLLAALYHESWRNEPWESEKTEADMEKYVWQGSKSNKTLLDIVHFCKESQHLEELSKRMAWLSDIKEAKPDDNIASVKPISSYVDSIIKLHNEGENEHVLENYKASVQNLLGLQKFEQ